MILKKIDEKKYEKFVNSSNLSSFYQSVEWYHLKLDEGKHCELLGLYEEDNLVGVSLIIYVKILKKYYYAYASRGFIYDYSNLEEFVASLKEYFKGKAIFIKIDPPIILNLYDKSGEKEFMLENRQLIERLKYVGFKHHGFNMAFECEQFRFVHKIKLESSYDEQVKLMSKSTRKNIELAEFRGVNIKIAKKDELDMVLKFLNMSSDRKHFASLNKKFYERLLDNFKDNVVMYLVYINKSEYINNLKEKINDEKNKLKELKIKMEHDNIGRKLKKEEELINNAIDKYTEELNVTKGMDNETFIAAMVTINKYNEVVSFTSGMDNLYRKFNPKYVMYPKMINDAINKKLEYVNFLGVKNIFDKNDPDYGMYEVKKGFGGKTVEYIGEFDLIINYGLYYSYKIIKKLKGRK